jgi:hypothetical protein
VGRAAGNCARSSRALAIIRRASGRSKPLSWVVGSDVERGRQFLNFSEWSNYSRAQKLALVAAMVSATNQNRMPPRPYVFMHPKARLSKQNRQVIRFSAQSEFRRLSMLRSSRLSGLSNRSVPPL